MGRPFVRELAQLSDTYAFARDVELTDLQDAIYALQHWPVNIVGSGGSLSACEFAARLHVETTGLAATALTPLEFVRRPISIQTGVLFISASGRNRDILAAVRHAVRYEVTPIVALVTRPDSPLARTLARTRHSRAVTVSGPVRKDGFLATNSLLLTASVLARAYGVSLPPELPALSAPQPKLHDILPPQVDVRVRPHLIVLASGWSWPAAVDLESKWSERGLGSVTVVDPRNFAHGRHTGLAEHESDIAVLGMEAGVDTVLANSITLLPATIRASVLSSPLAGACGTLDLLTRVMHLTAAAGERRGIDPGRPTVPTFGRRLYHAGIPERLDVEIHGPHRQTQAPEDAAVEQCIKRKVTVPLWEQASQGRRTQWCEAAKDWAFQFRQARFGAVVMDYDGTLCEASERRSQPRDEIGAQLTTLVKAGLTVAIATGRGISAALALRSLLRDPSLWPSIHVFMNNGATYAALDGISDHEDRVLESATLREAAAYLARSALLRVVAMPRPYPRQLTIRECVPLAPGRLAQIITEQLPNHIATGMRVLGSGATVDLVEAATSKQRAIEFAQVHIAPHLSVLSIGDQGQSGGNDHALLQHRFGLSVDQVSTAFDSCWNVSPVGVLRSEATLSYLRALRPRRDSASFDLSSLHRLRTTSVDAPVDLATLPPMTVCAASSPDARAHADPDAEWDALL